MLNVSRSKRFEATGGNNQKIGLNAFAIRKNVDVKRLKHQLWDHIHPKLDEINQKKKEIESKALNTEELKENLLQNGDETTMGNLMDDLYYNKQVVNPNNVSVHSAFICLLHLANEKGLEFDQKFGESKTESNFKIRMAEKEDD